MCIRDRYSSQPDKNHSQMKDSMLTLERAFRKCLRVGDVAAKYSDSQYLSLIHIYDYEKHLCCKQYDEWESE